MKESVSVEELIYLHQQASTYPEVDRWLSKLMKNIEFSRNELTLFSEQIAA